jgi:hypothetical protein
MMTDQVRIAVLADRHMFHVRYLRPDGIQACFDGQRRKTAIVFVAIETLFGNSKFHFAVEEYRRGRIRVEHIEAQNQHEITSLQ